MTRVCVEVGTPTNAISNPNQTALQVCSDGTIVVVDMASGCNPASRAWCLYEWDYTLHYHGADGLHMTVSGCK